MSTYLEEQLYLIPRYQWNGSKWVATTDITQKVVHESRTYPDTLYRPLPDDLFLNSTARSTSSEFRNGGFHDYSTGSLWMIDVPDYVRESAVPNLTLLGDYTVMRERLRNRARKSVRQSGVNLAMALAEYRKTAELYVSAAKIVASKGKSLAEALRRKKGVSKAWLAFQYGVTPHVLDILGSIDSIEKRLQFPVYISGVESQNEFAIELREYVVNPLAHKVYVEHHAKRRSRCQYRAKLNSNAIANVLIRHGFANPFLLAYELIPYSFVLDWWINVGDVLASLDNLLLLDELRVIESYSSVSGKYGSSTGSDTGGRSFLTPYSWSKVTRNDQRYRPQTISAISTFEYDPSVSLRHILNGAALLHVARKRFPT